MNNTIVTNQIFREAVFKEDAPFVHVTDFAWDPNDIPAEEHLRAWRGDWASRYNLRQGTNQYFCVSIFNPDEKGVARRRKALFLRTRCIVLDDVREKLDPVQAARLPAPSWILETSPGSEQWGYILTEPCHDRHRVENLLDGLVASDLAPSGNDPGMKGVTRYVRLPEGVNTKSSKLVDGTPRQCIMLEWHPERTTTLEALAAPFQVDLDAVRRDARVDGAANVPDHPVLQIPDIIRIKEVRSDGRFDITCPWVDEHTGAVDNGAAVFTNNDGTLGFKCHHGACEGRTARDLTRWVEEQVPGWGEQFSLWFARHLFKGLERSEAGDAAGSSEGFPPIQISHMDKVLMNSKVEDDLTPIPLIPERGRPTTYPLDAFPPLMRDAVIAIAEHVQAPVEIAGQCVLAAAAYLAQPRVNAPAVHDARGMPCSLLMLSVANSGERKSECRRLAFKPIDEAEKKRRSEYQSKQSARMSALDSFTGKDKQKYLKENPEIFDPVTLFSDATFESISGHFIRGGLYGSWDTDEGGQLFGGSSLKSETRSSTIGGLIKAFDVGTFQRSRAKSNIEGSGFAYDRRLSIHILVQDAAVCQALQDPLLRGQGFLPRFLFSCPDSIAGRRFLTSEKLQMKSYSDPRLQKFWARCCEIDSSSPRLNSETGGLDPAVIMLSDDALNVWLSFYNQTEGKQAALGEYYRLTGFAGRAGELARRVAAVLAFFSGQEAISGELMGSACKIVQYSLDEWLRYSEGRHPTAEFQEAQALFDWLTMDRRKEKWREFDKSKLTSQGPTRANSRLRDSWLKILVDHKYLLTTNGKIYQVNPRAEIAQNADHHEFRRIEVAEPMEDESPLDFM